MSTASENKNQILDLDALVPTRPKVKFSGGTLYDLTVPSDLGILEQRRIEKLATEVGAFYGRENELTDDEAKLLKRHLDDLAAMLVRDAPIEAMAALTDIQKIALANHFTKMMPETAAKPGDDAAPLSTSGR